MKFLEPDRLWLLVCLPIILLLFIRSWTSFSKFVNSPKANCFLFRSNLPNQWMRIMGGLMFVLAMASVIVGLAKPYYLVPVSKKEYLNVRIIFLLDVSLSMNFAEDVSPNRLAASKEWIADFYKSLDEIYEIALIPFAGDPNLFYCPPSHNYSAFMTLLDEVDYESVTSSGSDLAAVFSGVNSLVERKVNEWKDGLNLIVILSDGGKEDGFLIDRSLLQKEIKNLTNKGFKIYALGIGGKELTPLIKRDKSGNPNGFIGGNNNKTAYSQLDEDVLKKISLQGKGEYRSFDQKNEFSKVLSEMILNNRKVSDERITYSSVSIQHWFFALAVILVWMIKILSARV